MPNQSNARIQRCAFKFGGFFVYQFFFFFTDVCELKPEVGNCRASLQRWYFNPQNGLCQTFEYGGCDGNGNNFVSKEQCESFCNRVAPRKSTVDTEDCHLPAETGPCRAALQRYFFNKDSGKCEAFVFGGCSGNANNFASIEECAKKCKVVIL